MATSAIIQRYTSSFGGPIEYVIYVLYQGKQWSIKKRYSDFDTFDKKIKEAGYLIPQNLPPKLMWGSSTPENLTARMKGLQLYLDSLFTQAVPSDHPLVREFLEVDANNLVFKLKSNQSFKDFKKEDKIKAIVDHARKSYLDTNAILTLELNGLTLSNFVQKLHGRLPNNRNSGKHLGSISISNSQSFSGGPHLTRHTSFPNAPMMQKNLSFPKQSSQSMLNSNHKQSSSSSFSKKSMGGSFTKQLNTVSETSSSNEILLPPSSSLSDINRKTFDDCSINEFHEHCSKVWGELDFEKNNILEEYSALSSHSTLKLMLAANNQPKSDSEIFHTLSGGPALSYMQTVDKLLHSISQSISLTHDEISTESPKGLIGYIKEGNFEIVEKKSRVLSPTESSADQSQKSTANLRLCKPRSDSNNSNSRK